jgi:membrane protease YdiL (CAAX protease family)
MKFNLFGGFGLRTLRVIALQIGIALIIVFLVPITNPIKQDYFIRDLTFMEILVRMTKVALAEEAFFRIWPWLTIFMLGRIAKNPPWVGKLHLLVAMGSSVIFGLLHVIQYQNPPGILEYLGTTSQMFGGFLLWYIMDKEGVFASVGAHLLFNVAMWALIAWFF